MFRCARFPQRVFVFINLRGGNPLTGLGGNQAEARLPKILERLGEPCSTRARRIFEVRSGQQQIGERDHRGGGADQDQGVIGSKIVLHVERWLLRGHAEGVGQGKPGVM